MSNRQSAALNRQSAVNREPSAVSIRESGIGKVFTTDSRYPTIADCRLPTADYTHDSRSKACINHLKK
jgi:hypothetical protein